jgi:hypothetical protein
MDEGKTFTRLLGHVVRRTKTGKEFMRLLPG